MDRPSPNPISGLAFMSGFSFRGIQDNANIRKRVNRSHILKPTTSEFRVFSVFRGYLFLHRSGLGSQLNRSSRLQFVLKILPIFASLRVIRRRLCPFLSHV
jgi:hypothetical protein